MHGALFAVLFFCFSCNEYLPLRFGLVTTPLLILISPKKKRLTLYSRNTSGVAKGDDPHDLEEFFILMPNTILHSGDETEFTFFDFTYFEHHIDSAFIAFFNNIISCCVDLTYLIQTVYIGNNCNCSTLM